MNDGRNPRPQLSDAPDQQKKPATRMALAAGRVNTRVSAGLFSYPIANHPSKVSGQFQANSFPAPLRARQVLCQVVCQPSIWHTTPKCCAKWCANRTFGTPLPPAAVPAISALPLAHHSRRVLCHDRLPLAHHSVLCHHTLPLAHHSTVTRCAKPVRP